MAVVHVPTISDGMLGSVIETNVDENFADIDARLVVEETKTSVDKLIYTPQGTAPAHAEGTSFYDAANHSQSYQTEFPDVTIEAGKQSVMKVVNNTGVLIPKGKLVRHSGVGAGIPQIALAIATDFINSRILGIAAHDIPSGSEGYISDRGVLRNVNTSGVANGVPLYLSDTVAGEFTDVQPEIASQLGGALTSHATTGSIQVLIHNNVTNPVIGAYFQNTITTIDITTTPQEFDNFTLSKTLLVDISSGNSFKITADGVYGGSFTISMSNLNAVNNGHVITIELYNKRTTTVLFTYNLIVGRNDSVASGSFSAPVDLVIDDDISVRYSNAGANAGNAVVIDGISMNIESKQIR